MFNPIAALAGLVAAVLLAQPAPAQTLYKSITPDGRVVYSDKPPADAVKTEKRQMDTSKQGVVPPSDRDKAALKKMQSERKAGDGSQDRLRRAEIALHDAEVAQSMGKEPQAGERLGTVSGNQRLTDAYWERQKKLEDAVTTARSNLEKVRAGK
jgi:hypothetical protein